MPQNRRITLLAGGVGAARLLRGLVRVTDPSLVSVIVNTGDDDEFYGLRVSPDLDTIVYTLAGVSPVEQGWGIDGETFAAREQLDRLYGSGWFALGDKDLATHIFRTDLLGQGKTLSECTRHIADSFELKTRVLPMSNERVRTFVDTRQGRLAFQDYLVRQRARPRVEKVRFQGVRSAQAAPGVVRAIDDADLVLIAPSNPFVSIGPMLAMPEIRRALVRNRARVVAVSPLIGGRAVKGPLASMMRSLGHRPGIPGIAALYAPLAHALVVARGDTPRRRDPSWPEITEQDILIVAPKKAARLAKFLVESF